MKLEDIKVGQFAILHVQVIQIDRKALCPITILLPGGLSIGCLAKELEPVEAPDADKKTD